MKSTFARDFLTGLTAIASLVGLVVMLWQFGELRGTLEGTYEFTIVVDDAGGLGPNSSVTVRGVKVGVVRTARVQPPPGTGVALGVSIVESVKIADNFAVFVDRSLIGESSLQITEPGEPTGTQVARGGTYTRKASNLYDLLMEPLSRIGSAAGELERLARSYGDMSADVRDMLEPRSVADVESGKPANLRSLVARIDGAVRHADAWLGDEALRSDLEKLSAKADALLDTIGRSAEEVGKTATTARDTIERVGGRVDSVAATANGTLSKVGDASGEIAGLASAIRRGEGTAGQLVTNPDLYNNLRDAAVRLDRMLDELRLLLEKYRAEGIDLRL